MSFRPFVAVDVVLFAIIQQELKVLLVPREAEPYKGTWVVPGGIVQEDESLEMTAKRQLKDKTGITNAYLEQLYSFGDPKRDPRERSISIVYFGLIPQDELETVEKQHQKTQAQWHSVYNLPSTGFDHQNILEYALERLRAKLEYTNVAYSLLQKEFTLTDLQNVYDLVFNQTFDRRNFRKKVLSLGVLEPTGKTIIRGAHRPAKTYKFTKQKISIVEMT